MLDEAMLISLLLWLGAAEVGSRLFPSPSSFVLAWVFLASHSKSALLAWASPLAWLKLLLPDSQPFVFV